MSNEKRCFPIIQPAQYQKLPLSPEAFKQPQRRPSLHEELRRNANAQVREAYARMWAMGCINIRVEPLDYPSIGFKLVGDLPKGKA